MTQTQLYVLIGVLSALAGYGLYQAILAIRKDRIATQDAAFDAAVLLPQYGLTLFVELMKGVATLDLVMITNAAEDLFDLMRDKEKFQAKMSDLVMLNVSRVLKDGGPDRDKVLKLVADYNNSTAQEQARLLQEAKNQETLAKVAAAAVAPTG